MRTVTNTEAVPAPPSLRWYMHFDAVEDTPSVQAQSQSGEGWYCFSSRQKNRIWNQGLKRKS